MLRTITLAVAALSILSAAPAMSAEKCRDAQGKFIKCPAPAPAAQKPMKCKDAKGRFAKCDAPGAKPMPM